MTELIWDGKYDKDGKKSAPLRIALPFQTVETINESAADRARTRSLFAEGKSTQWQRRLIWGDKEYVLPSLLPELDGQVNLIYIDPPFFTGTDQKISVSIAGLKVGERPSAPARRVLRRRSNSFDIYFCTKGAVNL